MKSLPLTLGGADSLVQETEARLKKYSKRPQGAEGGNTEPSLGAGWAGVGLRVGLPTGP